MALPVLPQALKIAIPSLTNVFISTFKDTFHGQVVTLGYGYTAKCYDCHGTHDILPPANPASHLSRKNVVVTCAKCHPGAHRLFANLVSLGK